MPFSRQMSLALLTHALCSHPAASTPMREPGGSAPSVPSRHTRLITPLERPLMPIRARRLSGSVRRRVPTPPHASVQVV